MTSSYQQRELAPETEFVSLHSIYCDCERCTEVRKVEKEKK